ncbi:hypothetical protein MC885_015027 [Smutsia gigantea]|nr:hypothetical protein MC885_015027 [Smutsia gigantea]
MGKSECQYYIDQLEYLNERQKDPQIEASKVLLYHGELKNKNGHASQSHTLQAKDVFHKQQWFNCIQAAIAPFQQATTPAELQGLPELQEECVENNPSTGNAKTQKRASTASSVTQVQVDGDASACVSPASTTDDMKNVSVPNTASHQRAKGTAAQADQAAARGPHPVLRATLQLNG